MEDPGGPPVRIEVTDVLDLHAFRPAEIPSLVADYLVLAQEKGLVEIRLIHGKGRGVLRRLVRGILDRHPAVLSYRPAPEDAGGWGATLVTLRVADS
ncbi:Smr/MutS family protein [Dissulfurirhabdus thermomarina]|uniref:Smr/MutS family protein n=1 Tax=Dissulfurirhabdus thermomarina TaxID=1765737 RepID=UPI002852E7B1|nr:Smr/MutS family protein [Dissulfurirhabdus thermomarina]